MSVKNSKHKARPAKQEPVTPMGLLLSASAETVAQTLADDLSNAYAVYQASVTAARAKADASYAKLYGV